MGCVSKKTFDNQIVWGMRVKTVAGDTDELVFERSGTHNPTAAVPAFI